MSNSQILNRNAIFGSAILCASVLVCFLLLSPACRHWFAIPVLLCGILITRDAVRWCFSDRCTFDTEGLIGIVGFNFFFFSPLVMIASDFGLAYVMPPPAWQPLVGMMACYNFVGIAIYQFARRLQLAASLSPKIRTVWSPAPQSAWVLGAGLLVALTAQAVVYAKMGGISGYISAQDPDGQSMEGMGKLLMFGDAFALCLMCFLFIKWAKRRYTPRPVVLFFVFVMLLILQFFCGGLRGSRATIMWNFLLMIAAVHFYVRPVPKKWLLAAGSLGLVFASVYCVYKF